MSRASDITKALIGYNIAEICVGKYQVLFRFDQDKDVISYYKISMCCQPDMNEEFYIVGELDTIPATLFSYIEKIVTDQVWKDDRFILKFGNEVLNIYLSNDGRESMSFSISGYLDFI